MSRAGRPRGRACRTAPDFHASPSQVLKAISGISNLLANHRSTAAACPLPPTRAADPGSGRQGGSRAGGAHLRAAPQRGGQRAGTAGGARVLRAKLPTCAHILPRGLWLFWSDIRRAAQCRCLKAPAHERGGQRAAGAHVLPLPCAFALWDRLTSLPAAAPSSTHRAVPRASPPCCAPFPP